MADPGLIVAAFYQVILNDVSQMGGCGPQGERSVLNHTISCYRVSDYAAATRKCLIKGRSF